MSIREDRIKPSSSSPLKCCQSNDSLTSLSADDDDGVVCETKNVFVTTPENNNNRFLQAQMKNQHHFPKKQAVDLKFENITFTSWSWSITKFKREVKKILHGVSGQFKSGELSVIMGPSGAGKSTLLNVLAGFVTRGSTGIVKLNDTVRDGNPRYRKLSAYIPQDEELRLALTAKEAMTFAAHLKLGYGVSTEYKTQQVVEILELLGLDQCHHTLTSRLSGGQRKRLAVALELISNPPILFLDEPTTGLDSSSCTQCIALFKRLATEGRTVIATIHQPSALLFEMFDKLYALADGKCIYDGTTSNLVNYLGNLDLRCPPYHNPADYLIEVAIGEHGADISLLAHSARVNQQMRVCEIGTAKEKEHLLESSSETKGLTLPTDEATPVPAAIIMQFLLLYKRNLLTTRRFYLNTLNRLLAHVIIGFIFGYLYWDVGVGANTILANYVYIYGTLLLTVYTGMMPVTLSFPMEMRILTREHFNRWYKLTPYLLSVILVEIPFQVICVWIYIAISYCLTNQPLDFRLFLFILFCTAGSLCGQSMGYFIGSTTPIKVAVFVAPVLACFLSVFGFCIRYYDTPPAFRWIFNLSYYRAAFQSLVYTLYGLNRTELYCSDEEIYCHYQDPVKFLGEMDMTDVDLVSNISLIVCTWCLLHAATYLTLWIKLNKR
ncbi:ATP-binding cassette sub-family G member 4 [Anoplophora glabripennis]|uniref:ATP-binding cassette sub-family G member 4 n=1 Tax=Anoplophora glabripennis TaxID=217634 RepID=UPI000873CA28|nr:ATP-binding cassette sub-family G member 4 [Anoplophora glabripennis]